MHIVYVHSWFNKAKKKRCVAVWQHPSPSSPVRHLPSFGWTSAQTSASLKSAAKPHPTSSTFTVQAMVVLLVSVASLVNLAFVTRLTHIGFQHLGFPNTTLVDFLLEGFHPQKRRWKVGFSVPKKTPCHLGTWWSCGSWGKTFLDI